MVVIRKNDIIDKLLATSSRPSLVNSVAVAEDLYGDFCRVILNELMQGNDVKLNGVGTFSVKQYKGRRCNNISTGKSMFVAPMLNIRFVLLPAVKRALNRANPLPK